jgi:hypothetical protein
MRPFCGHADVTRLASSTAPNDNADSYGSSSQALTLYASYGIRAISDSSTMKDRFALKLQECVYIPNQRHQSIVPDLVKFSGSMNIQCYSAQFGLSPQV